MAIMRLTGQLPFSFLLFSYLILSASPSTSSGLGRGQELLKLKCDLTSDGKALLGSERIEIIVDTSRDLIQLIYIQGGTAKVKSVQRFSKDGGSLTREQLNISDDGSVLLFVDRKSGEFSNLALDAEVTDRSTRYGICKEARWTGFRRLPNIR